MTCHMNRLTFDEWFASLSPPDGGLHESLGDLRDA
jgi:hypothetical protein